MIFPSVTKPPLPLSSLWHHCVKPFTNNYGQLKLFSKAFLCLSFGIGGSKLQSRGGVTNVAAAKLRVFWKLFQSTLDVGIIPVHAETLKYLFQTFFPFPKCPYVSPFLACFSPIIQPTFICSPVFRFLSLLPLVASTLESYNPVA